MTFLENLLSKLDEGEKKTVKKVRPKIQIQFLFSVPGKPTIIIPYIVLKELDKLKISIVNDTAVLAQRAIAFIFEQLKMMPDKIRGQSAIENEHKLVDIQNSNDDIINCCLQFKHSFGNVMLLTNDINLMNKAICSQIDTFSKSEFEVIFLKES